MKAIKTNNSVSDSSSEHICGIRKEIIGCYKKFDDDFRQKDNYPDDPNDFSRCSGCMAFYCPDFHVCMLDVNETYYPVYES